MIARNNKRSDPYYQAQAILARRDHSVAEMRQKLSRKGFTPEQVTEATRKLQEQRLLDDEAFAGVYVQSLLLGKPLGRRLLAMKLKQKGVKEDIISRVLDVVLPASAEAVLAREAAVRWQKSHSARSDDRGRLYRYLASRGFSGQAIEQALSLPPSL